MVNKTEAKFKEWCDKNKYYCQKLQTHTSTGNGTKQPADFLVANFEGVYMVECKQRSGDLFVFDDLTQEMKLNILNKKTDKINVIILINFIKHDVLVKFRLNEYLRIKAYYTNSRKSINVKNINKKFKYSWKELSL